MKNHTLSDLSDEARAQQSHALISRCKRDVFSVLKHFSDATIRGVIKALASGTVNGSSSRYDLMGTIARINLGSDSSRRILVRRLELYRNIKRIPTMKNDFEYWFFQITGGPVLENRVSELRRLFTERTMAWCRELIAHRQSQRRQLLRRKQRNKSG